jgi:flavin-dependent dehydrogenase
LRNSGLATVILDKKTFPRDKVCGGWITPAVLDELEIDGAEYSRGRVFQEIHGFRTSRISGREIETRYENPISYGIRRCEFDDFLLRRCGASVHEGVCFTSLERSGNRWIVNDRYSARIVVGAGGHFCPVARNRGANARAEVAVAAQEMEFAMSESQRRHCSVLPEMPELYFCADLKGYGWCVRKGNYLNVGLGRLDPHALPHHVARFTDFLKRTGKVAFDLPLSMAGHSYLLYGYAKRNVASDGVLLIGDAAGLAYSASGEGIRPAVESGLLAAKAILTARRNSAEMAATYRQLLAERFGTAKTGSWFQVGRHLPAGIVKLAGQLLLASQWFSRRIILEQWFLHLDQPALGH